MNNRGVCGKNVSLGLDVEHDNRAFKEAIWKLGPNVTNTSVTHCALMLPIAWQTDAIARECNLTKRSGIHFVNTSNKDMVKMVDELIKADALTGNANKKLQALQTVCKITTHDHSNE